MNTPTALVIIALPLALGVAAWLFSGTLAKFVSRITLRKEWTYIVPVPTADSILIDEHTFIFRTKKDLDLFDKGVRVGQAMAQGDTHTVALAVQDIY